VFRPKDAPRYVPAEITIIVCWGVCLLLLVFIWWWYNKENKRKALIRASPDYVSLENQAFLDLTDGENHEFIYAL
jgi:ACS family allantoate permease-like MFS transporter